MQSRDIAVTRPATLRGLAGPLVESDLIALAVARNTNLLFANRAFCTLFGREDGLLGLPVIELVIAAHRERLAQALGLAGGAGTDCIASVVRADGSVIDAELRLGEIVHDNQTLIAISARDVTERRRTEAQLGLLAYTDPLTGLANRAMFADQLRQVALRARRAGQIFALLMLDLDGFKAVNDRHGHEAGDHLLRQIAHSFAACLRETDSVARLGGDEFVVLLSRLNLRADAVAVANRLIRAAAQPVSLGMHEVQMGTSVGIALFPEHAGTVDLLLAAADTALYSAKREGRGRYAWASAATSAGSGPPALLWNATHEVGIHEIDEQHARLAGLLNDLVGALRNGEDHTTIFREIIRYTEFHFASEERLMAQYNYADSEAHRDLHRRLLDDIRNLGLEHEGFSVSLILRYLQEWLLRHVDGADRELARALVARGVG
jgi:diguanylate cyclase (GGDEF)-like protein/hemerythrin-like metal-binding protein/PAS domain S-box-containing protein